MMHAAPHGQRRAPAHDCPGGQSALVQHIPDGAGISHIPSPPTEQIAS